MKNTDVFPAAPKDGFTATWTASLRPHSPTKNFRRISSRRVRRDSTVLARASLRCCTTFSSEPALLPHHWDQLAFAFLLIAILAPLCEELIFRGLLLDWLRQKMNVWIAALILSVVFSLLHLNPFSLGAVGYLAFFHRLLIGISASALAIKYRSLWPSFTLHATVNGIACIAAMAE